MEMRYENKCSESGWLVSGFRASNSSVGGISLFIASKEQKSALVAHVN